MKNISIQPPPSPPYANQTQNQGKSGRDITRRWRSYLDYTQSVSTKICADQAQTCKKWK
jgi:hypothetical protein